MFLISYTYKFLGFLEIFFCFSEKHNIIIPSVDDIFIARGRSRRKSQEVTNMHRFHVELFYSIIDMQLQELNDRFTEASTELLLCLAYILTTYLILNMYLT